MADASHVPENCIAKLNIAARNVNSLFVASTDIKKYVMLVMSVRYEQTRMKLNVDLLYYSFCQDKTVDLRDENQYFVTDLY